MIVLIIAKDVLMDIFYFKKNVYKDKFKIVYNTNKIHLITVNNVKKVIK